VYRSHVALEFSQTNVHVDDEGTPGDEASGSEGASVFSRLEETRTLLESKLGLDTLVEAYQIVQVCNAMLVWCCA